MARSLVWKCISASQLNDIKHPHPKRNVTSRQLLAKALGLNNNSPDVKSDISLDLYTRTLQFGQKHRFTDEQLSGLLGIVKTVHEAATSQRLPVTVSFTDFKSLLLKHSVQRPPWSIGLFTYVEMQMILQWMLQTYYQHYKLYQYAFTNRVTLSVTTRHPSDIVEAPPELQPLNAAITEEEHMQQQSVLQQEEAAKQKLADEERSAAEEAARLAGLRAEYEAAIPDEIKDKVQAAVDKELEIMRSAMEAKFKEQEEKLLLQINELQVKLAK